MAQLRLLIRALVLFSGTGCKRKVCLKKWPHGFPEKAVNITEEEILQITPSTAGSVIDGSRELGHSIEYGVHIGFR